MLVNIKEDIRRRKEAFAKAEAKRQAHDKEVAIKHERAIILNRVKSMHSEVSRLAANSLLARDEREMAKQIIHTLGVLWGALDGGRGVTRNEEDSDNRSLPREE